MSTLLGILGYITGLAYLIGVFFLPLRLLEKGEKGRALNRQYPFQSGSEMIEDSHIKIPFQIVKLFFWFSILLVIPSFFARPDALFGQNAIWISGISHYIDLFFIFMLSLGIILRIIFKVISKPFSDGDEKVNYFLIVLSILIFQIILYLIGNPIAKHSFSRIKEILSSVKSFF